MTDEIECSKCGMKMTARQESHAVACVTTGCPLENAAKAGQECLSAKNEKSLRGIIIGSNEKWTKLSHALREKARVAHAESERQERHRSHKLGREKAREPINQRTQP